MRNLYPQPQAFPSYLPEMLQVTMEWLLREVKQDLQLLHLSKAGVSIILICALGTENSPNEILPQ